MNTAGLLALAAPATPGGPAIAWGIRSSNMDLTRYGQNPRVHLFFGARYPSELYDLRTLWQIASTNPWLSVTPVSEFNTDPPWDWGDSVVMDRGGSLMVMTSNGSNGRMVIYFCDDFGHITTGSGLGAWLVSAGSFENPAHGVFTGTLQ